MIFLLGISIVLVFGLVVFIGAPYLPTLEKTKLVALDLLDLKPGQTLLELGSGDGRVMKAAAERNIKVIGYEINPILVILSWFVTRKYRRNVKIIWGNYWTKTWPAHDGIYVFLIDKYMKKLDKKIHAESQPGTLVASNTFKIPGKKVIASISGIYLYKY